MKKIIFAFFIFIFSGQNALAMNSRNITILAEPSMVMALTKIARLYSQQTNVITSLNFEKAVDLIEEIDAGESADLFISAHAPSIDFLKQKGLIDVYNIGYIAQDKMILVTSKSNNALPKDFIGGNISFIEALKVLDQNKATLLIDGDGSTVGKVASDFINKGLFTNLNLVKKENDNKKSLVNLVKNNPEYYALILKSQIVKNNDLQILAIDEGDNIFYQALVIAGDSMEVAREFLKFLKGSKAREILITEGFIVN